MALISAAPQAQAGRDALASVRRREEALAAASPLEACAARRNAAAHHDPAAEARRQAGPHESTHATERDVEAMLAAALDGAALRKFEQADGDCSEDFRLVEHGPSTGGATSRGGSARLRRRRGGGRAATGRRGALRHQRRPRHLGRASGYRPRGAPSDDGSVAIRRASSVGQPPPRRGWRRRRATSGGPCRRAARPGEAGRSGAQT
ncbi:hypothetical protein M885DRAFT_514511 [Pelagophyceae sp. CCMP2097]|nr:hypothetical protein M885DRAFT_514511 [Pelagophyceae sp. CCMP2097]